VRPQRERTPAEGQTGSKHPLELVRSVCTTGRCMQKAARRHSVLTRCSALRDLVMHSLLSTSRHQQERQQEPRLPLPRTHSHPCCTACCVSPWQAFKRVALAWEAGSVHASAWRAARTCAPDDVIVLLEFSPLDPPGSCKVWTIEFGLCSPSRLCPPVPSIACMDVECTYTTIDH
jgi:hypothetical protein